jgi:hypothetical protein
MSAFVLGKHCRCCGKSGLNAARGIQNRCAVSRLTFHSDLKKPRTTSVTILLNARGAQARQAEAFDGALPSEEFFDC